MKYRIFLLLGMLACAMAFSAASTTNTLSHQHTPGAARRTPIVPKATANKSPQSVAHTPAPQVKKPATSTPRPAPVPLKQDELDKLLLPQGAPADLANSLSIFYNGYRRSQLEPCGCISKQLGGIDKEARLMHRADELGLPVLKVDAGGYMKDMPNDNILMQTKHLLRAYKALKIDAINVGFPDLAGGVKYLKDLQTSLSLPLISANVVDQATSNTIFEPYKIIPVTLKDGQVIRIGVIGVTRPRVQTVQPAPNVTAGMQWTPLMKLAARDECRDWIAFEPASFHEEEVKGLGAPMNSGAAAESYKVLDPVEALKKYLPELREKSDVIVLLDYESRDSARDLLSRLGPDHGIKVVVAGEHTSLSTKGMDVQGVRLVGTGYEGKHAGMMLLQLKDKAVTAIQDHMIEVLQSIPVIPEITKFIEEYKADTAHLVAQKSNQPAAGAKISYAGAQACASCHAKEFAQWKASKHSKAMETLIANNSQFNPDCLRCHTTGYMVDNGFKDFRVTPQMGDVQCEVCHGPAFQHVIEKRREQIATQMGKPTPAAGEQQKLVMEFDEQFCSKCHDPENDNKFLFHRDIDLVNHTRTENRPVDAPITRETSGTSARESMVGATPTTQ